MDDRLRAFIERHPDAAMITYRSDGTAHMARIELGVVDGRIQSSGAPSLVRDRHVRRDPHCSLFVFGPHPDWVGLETEVTVLDGDDAPERLVALMQAGTMATARRKGRSWATTRRSAATVRIRSTSTSGPYGNNIDWSTSSR